MTWYDISNKSVGGSKMISLIVATSLEGAIGKDNKMLWHLPKELKFFKETTLHKPILMGRKTYESLGRPLPNRTNIILTRQQDFKLEGCEVVHTVEEALQKYSKEDLMVIGGGEVYKQFLPHADVVYLTVVDVNITNADAYFPELNKAQFELISSHNEQKDDKNEYNFTIYYYKRKKDAI